MARSATTRKAPARKSSSRPKKKRPAPAAVFNIGRLIFFLVLVSLFVATIAVVGYVIFFRVVVAAELPGNNSSIVFEEPAAFHPEMSRHLPDTASVSGKTQTAKIAIIIDDMGYHADIGKELLALDLNLTFSFLPYAPFTSELEEEAYQRGRTIMLHLPLEPRNLKWDPGPGALYLNVSSPDRRLLFDANLLQVPHATGVNNHMGSRYTESKASMAELVDFLAENELFFIDSFTSAKSKGMMTAMDKGLPTARRHVFLDNKQQQLVICSEIEKLVELSKRQDGAIGIAHPHVETLDALTNCAKHILEQVDLVGAGELAR